MLYNLGTLKREGRDGGVREERENKWKGESERGEERERKERGLKKPE